MKAFITATAIVATLASGCVARTEPSIAAKWDALLATRDQIVLSDGSSLFVFKKNGEFLLGPLGMSGRTVSGHWEWKDTTLVINGRWGWVNGLNPIDPDLRTMQIYLGLLHEESEEVRSPSMGRFIVNRAYFTIESVEKN